jgi:hypothetical protein
MLTTVRTRVYRPGSTRRTDSHRRFMVSARGLLTDPFRPALDPVVADDDVAVS